MSLLNFFHLSLPVIVLLLLAFAIVSVLVPWRWGWRIRAIILSLDFASLGLQAPSLNSSDLFVRLVFYLFFYGSFLVTILMIFMLIPKFSLKRKQSFSIPAPSLTLREIIFLRIADGALCFLGGIIVASFLVTHLVQKLSGAPGGFQIIATIAIAAFAILVLFEWELWASRLHNWRAAVIAMSAATTMLGASIYSALYPDVVLTSAENLSKDAPFCIALAARRRAAHSWEDLTVLTMDKISPTLGGTMRFENHVTLLIDRAGTTEPFHWSYRRERFLPGILNWNNHNRPNIPCRPARDFGVTFFDVNEQRPSGLTPHAEKRNAGAAYLKSAITRVGKA